MWEYNHTPEPDELMHYGVLGMKWGVRRSEAQLARARKKAAKQEPDHEDYTRAHSGRSYKAMSDKELQDVNKRLNMERQYKDLTKKTSTGKKIVKGIIAAGTTVAAIETAYKTFERVGKTIVEKTSK